MVLRKQTRRQPATRRNGINITPAPNFLFPVPAKKKLFGQAGGPTVNSLSANAGPSTGGNPVNLTGTNFTSVLDVTVGNQSAPYTVNSSTSITITVPPGPAGAWPVTVTTTVGSSSPVSAAMYTYTGSPVAAIGGVSPNSGNMLGGTQVTIGGYGFSSATSVYFGGVPAESFVVNADNTITAVSPPQAAGPVDITVLTPAGSTPITPSDQFTYSSTSAPSVTGLQTTSGSTAGGTSVLIAGSNFTGVTAVNFGTVPALYWTFLSDGAILATAPPQAAGTVDVTVTTPAGTSSTGSGDEFSYSNSATPTVTGLDVTSGTAAGGTPVTILGTGFTGATVVSFGGVPVPKLRHQFGFLHHHRRAAAGYRDCGRHRDLTRRYVDDVVGG